MTRHGAHDAKSTTCSGSGLAQRTRGPEVPVHERHAQQFEMGIRASKEMLPSEENADHRCPCSSHHRAVQTQARGFMTDQEPSRWEQDVAGAYVNDQPLHRPDTRVRHAIIFASAYLAVTILLTSLAVLALRRTALVPSISSPSGFAATRPVLATAIVYGLVSCLALGVCGRSIIIGLVRLYQHYAPDQIRRRCLFKPTCSEYAILAVLRYGVVLGGMKTFVRLHRRCRGTTYSIDYP